MNSDRYRIRRIDPRNIAIQRRSGKEWVSISYHGNSLNSLISGLSELIMAQHTPDGDNLSEQLARLQSELDSSLEFIEKLVKGVKCSNKK